MGRRWVGLAAVLGTAVTCMIGMALWRRSAETPFERPDRVRMPSDAALPAPEDPTPSAPLPKHSPVSPRSRASIAFDRLLAALRSGDRTKIEEALEAMRAELVPPPVPDADNVALLYKDAFSKIAQDFGEEHVDILSAAGEGALTTEQKEVLKRLVEKNRETLSLLRRAADRARCNFNLDYSSGVVTDVPHVNGMIRASKLLDIEAMVAEPGELSEIARASHRLSEAVAEEPLFLSQMVRALCHGLSADVRRREFEGEIPVDRLRSMLVSLAPEKFREGCDRMLFFELVTGVQNVLAGYPANFAGYRPETAPRAETPLTAHDLAYYAEALSEFSSLAGRPYYEVRESLERFQTARVAGAPGYADAARNLLPSFTRGYERQAVAEASVGAAQMAAALRLYREENGGYPVSVEELRGVLPQLPLDPFTGKPYLYRREGAGFVIYSVGSDRIDGGGQGGETGESDVVFRSPR